MDHNDAFDEIFVRQFLLQAKPGAPGQTVARENS